MKKADSVSPAVLIICYTFPPYPGIGGRRWAKFSKYLARKGYKVHVVCSVNPFIEQSLYTEDVTEPGISIHPLSARYPHTLLETPHSTISKLKYRFWDFLLKLVSSGTSYDKALFWKTQMLAKSIKIIKENKITTVIVSGAPFRTCYYATELKKIFPGLQLIADLRDPWTWGHSYGYKHLSKAKFNEEKRMERVVVEVSDLVCVPVEVMEEHLIREYPNQKEKIRSLPHAFDEDEITKVGAVKNTEVKRLLFYGTIYDGIGNEFEAVAQVVQQANAKLTIVSTSDKYINIFDKKNVLNTRVFYQGSMLPKQLFNTFENFNFILMVHHQDIKDYISTKFYEIIYSGVPIIFIGPAGKTSEFIIKNNIGVHILPEMILIELPQILSSYEYRPDLKFNIHDFSFSKQTDNLIKLFYNNKGITND